MDIEIKPDQPKQRPLRFLCLEDRAEDFILLKEQFRVNQFPVELICAETREEFETALRENLFDLILSDYSIPGYSGIAALAAAQSAQPDTPFLIVSGTIGEERAVESLKSGAADYVLKDHLDRLAPAVRRALREAAERRGRKAAEAMLKESEARFRQLAENVDEVLWLADSRSNQILYVNSAFEKIWGRTIQSLYDEPDSWLEAVHPDDRERVREGIATKTVYWHYDETYRIVRPDGTIRWIREQAFPIRNDAGDVYRLVRIADDITAHQLLEGQLRQAQKMEAVGQLAGGVAHDFNNILTVIRGNVDLVLAANRSLSNQDRECLNQVAGAVERAANLTRQLLAFSRKQIIQPKPLNVNDLIGNLTRMLNRVIGENIDLRCELDPDKPHVMADPGMIEQVLTNLIINARDAMPSGGTLTIRTEKIYFEPSQPRTNPDATAGDFVCLKVSDTGTGIAAEHLLHIFEPFYTTKDVGKGTGLGLAIAYGIIKQHRGWIEVANHPDNGATFSVFLPAIPPQQMEPGAKPEHVTLRGGNETILLVEDDAAVRQMTRRWLEAFGYKVWEASSAADAQHLLSTGIVNPDLLLTDVVIPGGASGKELAKKLRATRPDLKIVFMSGYGYEVAEQDAEFIRQSAAVFLPKPHSSSALLLTIRGCLDSK
jgi:two-component system cell cycle sensor histidine kinase/response regulator CckA